MTEKKGFILITVLLVTTMLMTIIMYTLQHSGFAMLLARQNMQRLQERHCAISLLDYGIDLCKYNHHALLTAASNGNCQVNMLFDQWPAKDFPYQGLLTIQATEQALLIEAIIQRDNALVHTARCTLATGKRTDGSTTLSVQSWHVGTA